MEDLRVGFLGAGGFATHTIYPALHFAPLVLKAICDMDVEKADRNAKKFGGSTNVYEDRHQMYQSEDLEAIVISMGPESRLPLVIEALEAGYHVFTPKPPAASLEATIKLADVARANNRKLMINFQRRFSIGVRSAIEIINQDSFGQISQIFCSFCSGTYGTPQIYLLDFAIHHFDLIRHLGGEVKTVSTFHNEIDGQGSFAVSVEFESGAVGIMQLNSQRLWRRNYDRIEITGQGQYVVLDGLWTIQHYAENQNTFTDNFSDQRNGELTGDGVSLTEFVHAIREDREPVASIDDCIGTMRLYDAVLQTQQGEATIVSLDQ